MASPNRTLELEGFPQFETSGSQPGRFGAIALQLLTRECAGQILAVVSNAAYLRTNDGEILWLAHDNVPMHTRAVVYTYDESTLHVGMNFIVRDAVLRVGERVTIDLRAARVWQPRAIAPSNLAPREVVSARVRVLETLAKRTTSLSIHRIVPMRHAKNIAAIAEQSKELIGLGAGLTPAGDDFVGGALFAARHVSEAYALTWDAQPVIDLLDWARTQTNVISCAILCDLAHGQGPEPLHDLLFASLARDPTEDLQECVTRLTRIGSSTGTEMLAGALTGMQMMTPNGAG